MPFVVDVGASRLEDQTLDIEHPGWKTRLKTLENSTEILVEINRPKIQPPPQTGFLKNY